MKILLSLFLVLFLTSSVLSQITIKDTTNIKRLHELAEIFRQRHELEKFRAIEKALDMNWPIQKVFEDGTILEIQSLTPNDFPIYYITDNLDAARTVSTDDVWLGGSAGLSLHGTNMTIGEWDGGGVDETHQELSGRVSQRDAPSSNSDHSTHVAGTLIATGVWNLAQGMANQAELDAYDWNSDESEMALAAADDELLVSNHSYGIACGWTYDNGWVWYGNSSISQTEDYKFGYYMETQSDEWDEIAYNAPYYLIVKSGGNHRGEGPFGQTQEIDGGTDGYDCLSPRASAKNLMVVGAVDDITGGYSQPSDVVMSSFSSWGPTDDGRIKPDIVANGIDLLSCVAQGTDLYANSSGTSMATPNAAGSIILLQQHFSELSVGNYMQASTLKALAIHTADEAGPANGPDYQFGWGLLNIKSAAELISSVFVSQINHTIREVELNNGSNYTLQVTSDGTKPLKVTICWTDPPGNPVTPLELDPPDIMLINDLDLRITNGGGTYYPWIMDPADPNNPATTATTGDNIRDNVEQVYIATPTSGDYTITVNHKGTIQDGSQIFSLIMSGAYFSDQPLPVQFSSFNITAGNALAIINWETQSETNNLGFNILRSKYNNGPYSEISTYLDNNDLKGLGSSSQGKTYQYYDFDLDNGQTYWYKIQDISMSGQINDHGPVSVTPDASSKLSKESLAPPQNFALFQNYPNPFNPETLISFQLSADSEIDLSVYNLIGQRIATIAHGKWLTGTHQAKWNGLHMPSGIYYYKLIAGDYAETKTMLLLR